MLLDRIPADKAKHFLAGSIIGMIGALVSARLHIPPYQGAVGLALLAGIVKEGKDAYTNKKMTGDWLGFPRGFPHGVEGWDALATTLGGAVVAAPLF